MSEVRWRVGEAERDINYQEEEKRLRRDGEKIDEWRWQERERDNFVKDK